MVAIRVAIRVVIRVVIKVVKREVVEGVYFKLIQAVIKEVKPLFSLQYYFIFFVPLPFFVFPILFIIILLQILTYILLFILELSNPHLIFVLKK